MAKEIDKIIQSKTAPKSNNVLWDDGENLKINRNGKWENANNTETNSLSIDPVVWKYLCNPLKLGVDTVIPEELLIDDGGAWFWKYPVPAIITGTNDGVNYIHATMGDPIDNGLHSGVYIEGLGYGAIDYETRKPLFI